MAARSDRPSERLLHTGSNGAGKLTYRTTQVITGHGCFGEYLHRIGAETTAACQMCGAEHDTAQHAVEECPSFSQQRRRLKDVIGPDITRSGIIRALMRGTKEEKAVKKFCEHIVTAKEVKQRRREMERRLR